MKNAVAKKNTKKELTLVSALPPAKEMDAAGQIKHFNQVAQQAGKLAIQAAIITGWLLWVEKAKRVGIFKAWCEANLDFTYRTCSNYIMLFERTVASAAPKLDCSDKDRMELVEEYSNNTDSSTLTDLYVDLGIVKKTPSNMGGKREGAGRKPKADIEELKAQAEYLAHDPENAERELDEMLTALESWAIAADKFALLGSGQIKKAIKRMSAVAARGGELIKAKSARGE